MRVQFFAAQGREGFVLTYLLEFPQVFWTCLPNSLIIPKQHNHLQEKAKDELKLLARVIFVIFQHLLFNSLVFLFVSYDDAPGLDCLNVEPSLLKVQRFFINFGFEVPKQFNHHIMVLIKHISFVIILDLALWKQFKKQIWNYFSSFF